MDARIHGGSRGKEAGEDLANRGRASDRWGCAGPSNEAGFSVVERHESVEVGGVDGFGELDGEMFQVEYGHEGPPYSEAAASAGFRWPPLQ